MWSHWNVWVNVNAEVTYCADWYDVVRYDCKRYDVVSGTDGIWWSRRANEHHSTSVLAVYSSSRFDCIHMSHICNRTAKHQETVRVMCVFIDRCEWRWIPRFWTDQTGWTKSKPTICVMIILKTGLNINKQYNTVTTKPTAYCHQSRSESTHQTIILNTYIDVLGKTIWRLVTALV